MECFVCQQNIAHYQDLLKSTTDELQRREVMKLLAAEEKHLKQLSVERRAALDAQ